MRAMQCPVCKKPVEEPRRERQPPGQTETAVRSWFPFCSERCKLIDLGRWLGGKYQIPVVERDESDEDAPPARFDDQSGRSPSR
jgi:endogenous inhibitor of DNA gyrase (YacG/DUF329 family)